MGRPSSLSRYGRQRAQRGIIAPDAPGWRYNQIAITANRATAVRFVPSESILARTIAFVLTTASGVDDACDVALLDKTGARIVSTGATSGKLNAALGVQTLSIAATALRAGEVYYAAFSAGAAGASLLHADFSAGRAPELLGSGFPRLEAAIQAAGHPIGATFVPATNTAAFPVLAIREA